MNKTNIRDYQKTITQFIDNLDRAGSFEGLFDYIPDVYFFVKDENYKLIMCNEPCLSLFRLTDKFDIIGKSEYDFFPKKIADPIHEDDVMVMEHRQPIIDRMELIVSQQGMVIWALTTKLPLSTKDGKVGGLMGITRKLHHVDMIPDSFKRHSKALEYIKNNYNQPIAVENLASMCNLSTSQFRSTFVAKFKMPPMKFILKIRIQMACRQLSQTGSDIASIAQECGFCDQSYFTRQFRAQVGMTPLNYRAHYSTTGR